MNKTTIKISVLAFLGFMTYGYAQQQQQDPYKGKVGVNTIEPSATMDIRPSTANAQKEATTNEGIIAPKLSKTRIANIETPVEGTLVYATDETTSPISAYTGGDTKVAKITEKGYYFYNGTEWVKAGSDSADQLWAQRDNGGVTETYLKPADANSDFVGYKSDRKFKINLGNVTESLFSNDRSPIEYFISSDLFPSTTSDYFAFSRNNLLLKQTQISRNFRAPYYGIANIIKTENIVTPFQEVTGNLTISEHSSSAKANEVVGSFTLSKSTALSQAGRISGIVVTAENQGTAENMSAIRSYIANKGNITNIRGIYNFVKSNSETNPHNIALYRGGETD